MVDYFGKTQGQRYDGRYDDLMLLYTDGVTESFSPAGELFGEERLLDALKNYPAQNAKEALEIIEGCLNEFSDPLPPGDDLTMLAVRRVVKEP